MRPILVLISFATGTVAAQTPVTRTFAKPDAEYAETFTQVSSVRELKDGRVLVVDPRDKLVQLIDFTSNKAVAVGSQGSGPTEWSLPGRLIAFTGDSTLLADGMNTRFLVIGPDGKAVRTMSPAAAGANAGSGATSFSFGAGGATMGGANPRLILGARFIDRRGRFYFVGGSAINIGPGGSIASADSLPLVRAVFGAARQDTIAWLSQLNTKPKSTASNGGTTMSRTVPPFQAADDWAVFDDGRVAIARAAPYHVEVVRPDGSNTIGSSVPFTPVRIGDAEKEEWRASRRGAQTIGFGPSGANTSPGGAPPVVDPAEWPATKSAFLASAVFAAPNGETWVVRARAAKDDVPVADAFNEFGEVTAKIVFPKGTRLIGFGSKGVYLARVDSDDLQHLQRYTLP